MFDLARQIVAAVKPTVPAGTYYVGTIIQDPWPVPGEPLETSFALVDLFGSEVVALKVPNVAYADDASVLCRVDSNDAFVLGLAP
jgi:hypothetical protein